MIYDFLVCVALLVCHCAIVSFGHHVLVVRHNLLISCITVDPHLGPFMRLLILSRGRALLNHVSSFERTVQNHMLLWSANGRLTGGMRIYRSLSWGASSVISGVVEAGSCRRGGVVWPLRILLVGSWEWCFWLLFSAREEERMRGRTREGERGYRFLREMREDPFNWGR